MEKQKRKDNYILSIECKEIDDQLEDLNAEIFFFLDKLESLSNKAKKIEAFFKTKNLNIPYKFIAKSKLENGITTRTYISWEKFEDKQFRLLVVIEEQEPSFNQIYIKPFVELPILKKIKFSKYLPEFLTSYIKFLRDLREEL